MRLLALAFVLLASACGSDLKPCGGCQEPPPVVADLAEPTPPPADLAMPPADLAMPASPDLAQPVDLAAPEDLARPIDLAEPRDLAQPDDLSTPPGCFPDHHGCDHGHHYCACRPPSCSI